MTAYFIHTPFALSRLAFDDVIIDKSRSDKIKLVNWQYSGKHDKIKGIGVVNALWQVSTEQHQSQRATSSMIATDSW